MRARRISVHVTTILLLSACGKSGGNCPGLCPDETIFPTTTISTADDSASIASARIVSGPCTHLLIHSSGEVGVPTTYAAVQLSYNGPASASQPLCGIELTSQSGQTQVIWAQVTSHAYQQACCLYGSCCLPANVVTQHYHVQFAEPTQTFSFPPAPDGGAGDDAADAAADAIDAPPDQGEDEAAEAIDANPSAIDLADIDSPDLDSSPDDQTPVDALDQIDLANGS